MDVLYVSPTHPGSGRADMAAGNVWKMNTSRMSSSPRPLCHTKVRRIFHQSYRAKIALVVYKDGREAFVSNPAEFPDVADPKARVERIEEPMGG